MALSLKPVEAGRGPRWIADAFRLYARRPLGFTALFGAFLFAAMLLSLGFMVAGQSALLGGSVHPRQFIEPLRTSPERRRALLVLCVSYGVLAIVILLLADAVSNNAWDRMQKLMARGDGAQPEIDALLNEPGVATGAFLGVVLGTLLSVPYWHAPALVHWGGQGVTQALFSSTLAVWRNKGAFMGYMLGWAGVLLAFGVLTAVVFVAIGAPQLAGMLGVPAGLVFSTVFYLSVLFTFTDSFGGTPTVGHPQTETQPL